VLPGGNLSACQLSRAVGTCRVVHCVRIGVCFRTDVLQARVVSDVLCFDVGSSVLVFHVVRGSPMRRTLDTDPSTKKYRIVFAVSHICRGANHLCVDWFVVGHPRARVWCPWGDIHCSSSRLWSAGHIVWGLSCGLIRSTQERRHMLCVGASVFCTGCRPADLPLFSYRVWCHRQQWCPWWLGNSPQHHPVFVE
jgi:hypothetical protein